VKDSYSLTRFFFLRGLGLIYLFAFCVAFYQFVPLLWQHGIFPVGDFFNDLVASRGPGWSSFWMSPSLFWLGYSDTLLQTMAGVGIGLSIIVFLGFANSFLLFALWALYLSFVNTGQLFYGYGWETMLLETGFLAIFLPALWDPRPFPTQTAAPVAVLWLLRWELFRVMFGAGLIKLRGDPCWRDLSCLFYHFETQPIPNPLSWYFNQMPPWALKGGVVFNHVAELIAPFLLFGPRRIRQVGAFLIGLFQFTLILSGNLSWLNYLTLLLCVSCFDDRALRFLTRKGIEEKARISAETQPSQLRRGILYALVGLVSLLSIQPILNLFSAHQRMNFSFTPLHLVNTYGAFGSVTPLRREIIFEGTSDEKIDEHTLWKPYEFKCKPGDVARRPCIVSPYHLRLDWQLWFAAMEDAEENPWLLSLIEKLLKGDTSFLALMGSDPFPEHPPRFVRAMIYEYHFTKWADGSGDWWRRKELGIFMPPLTLKEGHLADRFSN